VAWISADLKRQILTNTWPYCPMAVTFAPDGSIWTIGRLKDEANTRVLAETVVRRYDHDGKMLGSNTIRVRAAHGPETSELAAGGDRVGWFTQDDEYIEFALDGSEIARYPGPKFAWVHEISGLAISNDGKVIAGFAGSGKGVLVTLDRQQHSWTVLPVAYELAKKWVRVLGFDGSTLVTQLKSDTLGRFKTE
jgi:hypothetical protein